MELHILEHRLKVTSIAKPGLHYYTHSLIKLAFLRDRSRCKFFSLTETPDDYTVVLDEEGYKELPPSEYLQVVDTIWLALNVVFHGISANSSQIVGVTKIAKSVIAPLAEHGVSVFLLSTYQTDFIMIQEKDFPVVICTLSEEFTVYREESGESVPVYSRVNSNGFFEDVLVKSETMHPISSPQNQFCVMSLDPCSLSSVATVLIDVMFYSGSEGREGVLDQNSDLIKFFSFSLIDGYISIVMDAELQKKFPVDVLLTSSTGELWRMVRIGGQPLGFEECGIVAQISRPLADADISAYYISTFKFDHALVPEEDIDLVVNTLMNRQEMGR
ncbi:cytosolic arginine sensor for mTORC1 subunit 1-like [Protopterus annectens]|uniref:cytosolic arginine sensor for mTORC1 subunit 1-like n=1 Tax=Protopterus annectens TaxID=7888 RepID=UPI001CFA493F|nr:cytosolic arginine sensor for mTORC1 subunit 1-like [Protopterus annectens]